MSIDVGKMPDKQEPLTSNMIEYIISLTTKNKKEILKEKFKDLLVISKYAGFCLSD